MKVLLTDNAHLYKAQDGKYYTPSIYSYNFFQRYLNIFENVRFLSRTKHVEKIDTSKYLLVSCDGLEIFELPWYQGLKEMIKIMPKLIARYKKACDGCDCYIFRIAQIESYFSYFIGNKKNKPYAVEIVNDPAAFIDFNNISKWLNVYLLRYMIKRANGVSYVTKNYLQEKYPSNAKINGENDSYFESYYSSIELEDSCVKYFNKCKYNQKDLFEIIHISNVISGNSKGHKTFIEVLKIVNEKGYNVIGCCIGDGDSVNEFKKYAKDLGVIEKINFIGRLNSKEEVMERLSQSDLFLFPTYYEGLPRCIIEAQAVGLPCLSTNVGGIPELLPRKYLFKPDDSKNFARKLMELIDNPDEIEDMSQNNLMVAKNYIKSKLLLRRNEFYLKLKKLAKLEKLKRIKTMEVKL